MNNHATKSGGYHKWNIPHPSVAGCKHEDNAALKFKHKESQSKPCSAICKPTSLAILVHVSNGFSVSKQPRRACKLITENLGF